MKKVLFFGLAAGVLVAVYVAIAHPNVATAAQPGFVYAQNGKLMLDGQEYFAKGMNTFHPFRYTRGKFLDLSSVSPGTEWYEAQMFWHDFDAQKIEEEFRYYHDVLGINTIRLFTPSLKYFDANIQYHGWDWWFATDGSINPTYRDRIVQIIDIAQRNNMSVLLELFHNSHFLDWECRGSNGAWADCSLDQLKATAVSGADGRFVEPGTSKEARYLKYLQSLIPYLKDKSAVLGYEVSSESLLDWQFNGSGASPRRDWFQDKVGSFILRMTREIRRLDGNHLITEGEVTEYGVSQPGWWAWPSPEFGQLNDIHNLNGGQPYTLESFLDFLSPHFYLQNPAYVGPALTALRQRTTKPIALGEFGYFLSGVDSFAAPTTNQTRLSYIQNVLALPRAQMSGYFLWSPLVPLDFVPGYSIVSMPNSPWGAVRGVKFPGTPERTVISVADPAMTMFSNQFSLFTYDSSYPFNMKPLPEATAYFGTIQAQTNGATCVSSTIPSSMTTGETRSVTVQFQNSGTKPWIATGGRYNISLVPWPQPAISLMPSVFSLPRDIQPGETLTHTFTLTAPQTAGNYSGQYQVYENGVNWFGATCGPQTVTVAAPTAQTNGATFVSQSIPSTMTPGQTATATITFRNSGTKAWDKIGSPGDYGNAYRIKSQNPADNTTWGTSFVPIPSAPIAPGQSATFTFTITAPTTPGTYNFQWQMNQGGVGWFGDLSPNRAIVVAATVPAQTNDAICISSTIPSAMTTGETRSVTVQFKNTGTKPWIATGGKYNISLVPWPQPAISLMPNVFSLPRDVQPGETLTHTFTLTAPQTLGTYSGRYQVYESGVNWFGATCGPQTLTVTAPTQTVTPTPTISAPPVSNLTFTIDGGSASSRPQTEAFSFAGSGFSAGGVVQRWASFGSGTPFVLSPDFPASTQGLVNWTFTPSCTTAPGTYTLWLKDIATGRTTGQVTETVLQSPVCASNVPPPPSQYNLREGDVLSATNSSDPDVYIVNASGFKRLFLNPVIFSFYGHLGGWSVVKTVSAAIRDSFTTSGLFRNCETNDAKIYAVEVTGEDAGVLHHVNITGAEAVAQDPQFFKKVFCINSNEFNWYPKGSAYTSLSQVPRYNR